MYHQKHIIEPQNIICTTSINKPAIEHNKNAPYSPLENHLPWLNSENNKKRKQSKPYWYANISVTKIDRKKQMHSIKDEKCENHKNRS